MKSVMLALFFSLVLVSAVPAADDLVTLRSSHDVRTTADRLEKALLDKGMKIFLRIDQAAAAQSVGRELRPTELVVFGNPKIGVPLMQCSQKVAIDLPQKALIWEDETGQVWFSYNAPDYIVKRHAISGCGEVIDKLQEALGNFAGAATSP